MADANSIVGIDRIAKARLNGAAPSIVFLVVSSGCRLASGDIAILPTANVERVDLRPLVGLRVIVLAESYTPWLMRLFARLQEYAGDVTIVVRDWLPEDIGLRFVRGQGAARPFGDGPVQGAA